MARCCGKYSASMLRETVSFETVTHTPDGAGGYTESWAAISGAPTRAYVRQLSSRELWGADRVEGVSTHLIVVRYTTLLDEADRAVIRGREYNIDPPNNIDFMNRWLEIPARLGVAV